MVLSPNSTGFEPSNTYISPAEYLRGCCKLLALKPFIPDSQQAGSHSPQAGSNLEGSYGSLVYSYEGRARAHSRAMFVATSANHFPEKFPISESGLSEGNLFFLWPLKSLPSKKVWGYMTSALCPPHKAPLFLPPRNTALDHEGQLDMGLMQFPQNGVSRAPRGSTLGIGPAQSNPAVTWE